MVHYLRERPGSPNNGLAPTYLLIASRLKETHGASRGGVYLASLQCLGIMRLSCTNMIIMSGLDGHASRARRTSACLGLLPVVQQKRIGWLSGNYQEPLEWEN